jgi:hypothetical protein
MECPIANEIQVLWDCVTSNSTMMLKNNKNTTNNNCNGQTLLLVLTLCLTPDMCMTFYTCTITLEASLSDSGVTSSFANRRVVGSSPAWVVSSPPRVWVFVCVNLFVWYCGW